MYSGIYVFDEIKIIQCRPSTFNNMHNSTNCSPIIWHLYNMNLYIFQHFSGIWRVCEWRVCLDQCRCMQHSKVLTHISGHITSPSHILRTSCLWANFNIWFATDRNSGTFKITILGLSATETTVIRNPISPFRWLNMQEGDSGNFSYTNHIQVDPSW